jgi:hypothetical protein
VEKQQNSQSRRRQDNLKERKMKKFIPTIGIIAISSLGAVGVAYGYAQFIVTTIKHIECHNFSGNGQMIDNLCQIIVVDEIPGFAGCEKKNDVVFDATTPNGKNILTVALSAYLAGKRVGVDVMRCTPALYNGGPLDLPEVRSLTIQ